MRIWGQYEEATDKFWAKYVVVLLDEGMEVDRLEYEIKGRKVCTPSGYTKDPEGARRAARDYWF